MKVKRVLMMLVMFASIAAQAQGYDDECQDILRRIKKTYVERGEEYALRQIELLCGSCDPSICSEARAWLREQKNKSRNNNSYNEQTFRVKGVEFKMIKVEGGTFSMGATSEQGSDAFNNEKPVHSVTLSDYYMGETEVTQELWEAVMGSNPSEFKGNNQRPVENVSWDCCQKFIKKLNQLTGKEFRLPTEAEWEYAARGGKYSRGYKYSGSNDADEVAWYDRNSGSKTHPVKTKKANELGLYDMSGNVWEWCNDRFEPYQSYSQTNPTGPSEGEYRVLRGGGWDFHDRYERVSIRIISTPDNRSNSDGLRLAFKTSQIEAPKKQYLPQNQSGLNEQTFRVKGVEFKMIKVEGGTFSMGATSEQGSDAFDNEYPVHSVTLSDYYMGETEVTQELWEAVMGSNPSWFKYNNQRPVENVSWDDCQEFIKKLNQLTGKEFRLPTEAEWEYAARGGKYSKGYKYSGSNNADEVAWYGNNSGGETHSVKTKKANKLGLYDMSGNVWEWCNDRYGDYQSYSQTNPTGPSQGEYRVFRGGSWYFNVWTVRVSNRGCNTPDYRDRGYGLRLAFKTSQIEAPKKQYLPQNQSGLNEQTFTVKGVEFKMIKVEGGTFSMGATLEQGSDAHDDEKPVHSVTLSDYYMGETEVTQELWQAVMGSNPSYFKGNNQRPVEYVSWEDCQEFIKKLNSLTGKKFRLPTEAEWEYAARGGKYSRGYKYSGSNNADEVAWYWQNSGDKYLSGKWNSDRIIKNNCKTHPVKTKKANKLGLYDMSGNVWEWCNDWYGDYQSYSQTNPTGPSKGEYRVLRGGSWYCRGRTVRVSDRNCNTPVYRSSDYGLRLAF